VTDARKQAVALMVMASGALWPAGARAWTETDVQSVSAHVAIRPDGGAHVTMELTVRVRRGWLEGLEITGLDPDLVPDPAHPPRWSPVEPPDGAPDEAPPGPTPTLDARGGRIQLTFPRKDAPRRGTYHARFAYFTTVRTEASEQGRTRVGWSLPPWRAGLDDVQVTLEAPAGSRPAVDAQTAPSNVTVTHTERGGSAFVTFQRAHLPRTVSWPLAVDVPTSAMDAVDGPTAPEEAPAAQVGGPTEREASPSPWPLILLLLLLALGKIVAHRRASRLLALPSRGLVALPWGVRAAACAGAAVGGILLYPSHPTLGVGALLVLPLMTWTRVPSALPAARLGAFRRLGPDDRRRARRRRRLQALHPLALLHVGSPAGALLLTTTAAGVAWAVHLWAPEPSWAWIHALAVGLPLGLAASPRALPASPEARLARLERLARRLRVPLSSAGGYALGAWVHEDTQGRWQDVRLRVEVPHPLPGLVHLDLAVASVPACGELWPEVVLLAVTRRGSVADDHLGSSMHAPTRIEAPGGRVVRIASVGSPSDGLVAEVAQLAGAALPQPAPTGDPDAPQVRASSRPAAA
jgi:hypothetical protein